eukprot:2380507-Alexandrium_andersonii.AAC.1
MVRWWSAPPRMFSDILIWTPDGTPLATARARLSPTMDAGVQAPSFGSEQAPAGFCSDARQAPLAPVPGRWTLKPRHWH